ncbi:hypothetical protein Tsubulata_011496 [Turnera subulata]|uniref:Acyl-coenzyme A oxidase n=1 Tax=Turnera subulata TaxID=218843 RepID=A0A9Q0GE24_9ROSI|nr:hypothetical protein Tsubulata_011496 [Turnera subulata]
MAPQFRHNDSPNAAAAATRRAQIVTNHLVLHNEAPPSSQQYPTTLSPNVCLSYSPPELTETISFDTKEMRRLLDVHHIAEREWLIDLIEGQMAIHFFLWGSYIKFLGTKRHEKWLKATESYEVIGCLAMSELGHGSNAQGAETVATYDSSTGEFVVNTPCESAQKHMIGLSANYATHAMIFAQLYTNGRNHGVHGFLVQIRDGNGKTCPNVRIADCGLKSGLNAIDNGQIWFDNVRIPRENLLNGVADVLPDGRYVTKIEDPRERFGTQLAPLTIGRVIISTSSILKTKVSLAIAIRYALSRRAFSVTPNGPEVLLLDYPSHQRRLLPLLAKTYAMTFAGNWLKVIFTKREPQSYKTVHVFSVAFKTIFSWHSMRTLQECREACGAQGMKAVNRLGLMVAESDAQLTYEGDNNILLLQVAKILLSEFLAAKKHNRPLQVFGLEHMNEPTPGIPPQLSSSILRSSQFQIAALRLRERDLLHRFASEVSQHQFWGETKDQAINLAYHLYKELSKAFTDRMILQLTIEAEEGISAGPIKDVLALLRSLYALICIEEDDTFMRYGHLSAKNAATVREEVTKLCSELRPHALALVSSFGIPDSFLAPIAFDWVEANSWSSVSGGH